MVHHDLKNWKVHTMIPLLVKKIYDLTPRTNCRKCSLEGCEVFAQAVVAGYAVTLKFCPYINDNKYELITLENASTTNMPKKLLVISSKFHAYAKIILLHPRLFSR